MAAGGQSGLGESNLDAAKLLKKRKSMIGSGLNRKSRIFGELSFGAIYSAECQIDRRSVSRDGQRSALQRVTRDASAAG
jgi:hypothetical protein